MAVRVSRPGCPSPSAALTGCSKHRPRGWAALIWRDVTKILGIADALPPWQIMRERRATFAALPHVEGQRPSAATRWTNLVLAGDWTATSLPATIEGAIRSGNRAADVIGSRT